MQYSVGCKYLLYRLYALLCWLYTLLCQLYALLCLLYVLFCLLLNINVNSVSCMYYSMKEHPVFI